MRLLPHAGALETIEGKVHELFASLDDTGASSSSDEGVWDIHRYSRDITDERRQLTLKLTHNIQKQAKARGRGAIPEFPKNEILTSSSAAW